MPILCFLLQVAIEFNLKLIEQELQPTQQAARLGLDPAEADPALVKDVDGPTPAAEDQLILKVLPGGVHK
ncbi:hypothetical protein CPB97_003326 [Podila verticillata]|nr:hypothetical protein CPB97_003326 [Podila verticillata]